MTRRAIHALLPAVLAGATLLSAAGALGAQVAPTLPSDTLGGKRLPPESSVPRGIVAPTLPSDTLRAGACLEKDTLVVAMAPTTPRLDVDSADSADSTLVSVDSAAAPCANGTIPRNRKRGNS